MHENSITFDFEEISDELKRSKVRVHDSRHDSPREIRASINDWKAIRHRELQPTREISDLIDLAVSIYVADRWAKAKRGFPRAIVVRLPVRTEEVLDSPEVPEILQQMLYWFTGDNWSFEFVRHTGAGRRTERQSTTRMNANSKSPKTEVALWSGGLDALAGLCNRADQSVAERFVLVGTGAKAAVWGLQNRVHADLDQRVEFLMDPVPLQIHLSDTRHTGLRYGNLNRARGAVFLLLGSAYALLEQQSALAIYENGPGALNLPFRASEVALDHSRGVHPLSLAWISRLVSEISGTDFAVHNPFISWTKAEMCRVLDKMNLSAVAGITQSCDRAPRSKIPQCGTCSSCILRRQALLAADITDTSEYLVHRGTDKQQKKYFAESHLPYMMYQARNLRQIFESEDAWDVLRHKHPTLLGDISMRLPVSTEHLGTDFALESAEVLRRYGHEWSLTKVRKGFASEYVGIVN